MKDVEKFGKTEKNIDMRIRVNSPKEVWNILNSTITKQTKIVFIATVLIGMFTHSFMLFNKISFHVNAPM